MIEHNRCDECGAFVENSSLCDVCQKLADEKAIGLSDLDLFQNQNIPEGK